MTYREVQMQRPDRPYEVWKGTFEDTGPQPVVRCGVCLEGRIEPLAGRCCLECGAVIKRIIETGK